MTNSAGTNGANPTRMFTTPFATSVGVVVVESHCTRNELLGVVPANAPWRNRLSMNAFTSWVSAVHSGWEFGSNTAQVRLAYSVCSMNRAIRRTAMYFHCCLAVLASAPAVVRAPKITVPTAGNWRRQLSALRFRTPCWRSVIAPAPTTPVVPVSTVSIPAGDFHTPRALSSCPYMPATKPLGGAVDGAPVSGSAVLSQG